NSSKCPEITSNHSSVSKPGSIASSTTYNNSFTSNAGSKQSSISEIDFKFNISDSDELPQDTQTKDFVNSLGCHIRQLEQLIKQQNEESKRQEKKLKQLEDEVKRNHGEMRKQHMCLKEQLKNLEEKLKESPQIIVIN
ncbi:215_t:CDS:1, partial [Gigaspora margarita]